MTSATVAGLLLAAGSGIRIGGPKALLVDEAGTTFLARAISALDDGGCEPLLVVVGAAAALVRAEVPPGVGVVVAAEWQEGMGSSLRRGLLALAQAAPYADGVLVMLVDTPGVSADVVRRVVERAARSTPSPAPRPLPTAAVPAGLRSMLARASYDGVPGHPVLLGRDHWSGVVATAQGDRGARDYLRQRSVMLVECADVGSGTDIDTAEALSRWRDDAR